MIYIQFDSSSCLYCHELDISTPMVALRWQFWTTASIVSWYWCTAEVHARMLQYSTNMSHTVYHQKNIKETYCTNTVSNITWC